jgi:hypothetical protein
MDAILIRKPPKRKKMTEENRRRLALQLKEKCRPKGRKKPSENRLVFESVMGDG